MIKKLQLYGFSKELLKLVFDYHSDDGKKQRFVPMSVLGLRLYKGISQGSAIGYFLFKIYVNDLFYLLKMADVFNICKYTTFFACDPNLKFFMEKLKHDKKLVRKWLEKKNKKNVN